MRGTVLSNRSPRHCVLWFLWRPVRLEAGKKRCHRVDGSRKIRRRKGADGDSRRGRLRERGLVLEAPVAPAGDLERIEIRTPWGLQALFRTERYGRPAYVLFRHGLPLPFEQILDGGKRQLVTLGAQSANHALRDE